MTITSNTELKELIAEVEYDYEGKHVVDVICGIAIAYEGCHKIYVCQNDKDIENLKALGYSIYSMFELPSIFDNSCSLKFISSADLLKTVVPQFAENVAIGVSLYLETV